MQSDFEPKHLKKANETLSKHLRVAAIYANVNEAYKKELLKKPSLWRKFLTAIKNHF